MPIPESSMVMVELVLSGIILMKKFELLDGVLINRIHHVEDLETLLAKGLKEWRRGDASNAFTSDVINVVLSLLHAINILLEANLLIARLGDVIAQELSNLHSVCRILVDAKFDVLRELLVKLLVVILLLGDFGKHFKAFLNQVLLDHTQNFILLESLARDVQWQVLRVNHTLDKREPLWHEFIAIIHDEHTAHVELDVGALLLGLEPH